MKRFRRIFLHIGPHKTGSSAVQLMCDENRSRLAAAGIYYPRGRWHGQLGSYFSRRKAAYVFNRHAGNIDAAAIEASDLAYMGGLEQELNEVGTENLLFSYEGFIDLDSEELTALRNFLLGYSDEIQVIGYCRHPLSFVPSEISQRCRMGAPFFFSSRRRHTRYIGDWSSDVCSSD